MMKITDKNGFASFSEIIIASTIFLITAVGIYSTIAMITPQAALSTRNLEAAYVGRGLIEQLISEISATTWRGAVSNLSLGSHSITIGDLQIDYNLTEMPGFPPNQGPRQLDMAVTY